MFADLFPSARGQQLIPADVIATATVLQSLESLSDREAARVVLDRISWKVACALALDDGFDPAVITYWRTRLRLSHRPDDAVREVSPPPASSPAGAAERSTPPSPTTPSPRKTP